MCDAEVDEFVGHGSGDLGRVSEFVDQVLQAQSAISSDKLLHHGEAGFLATPLGGDLPQISGISLGGARQ
jgi:hypothetical protein